MRVEIIDDTHQRFNGVTYRRNKRGWFQTPYSTIHRDVWTFHNGKIPDGYEIHHIDTDKANNQIENLQCVTRAEHGRLHAEIDFARGLIKFRSVECTRCGKSFKSSDKVPPPLCPTCRKPPAPPKPKKVKLFKPPRYRTCVVCGKPFLLTPEKRRNQHRTCSPECHVKIHGTPIPEKICLICGKTFKGIHSWQKTCSPECGAKYNGLNQRGKSVGERVEYVVSKCELCGKEIRHRATEPRRFCSHDCANTFMHLTRRVGLKSTQEIRTCACCGKSFVASKTLKKNYCSVECREKLKLRTCPICGKIYKPNTANQKACCRQCSQRLRRQS